MGQFTAQLFQALADAAFVRSDPTKKDSEASEASGFTQGDIREIEKFKNAAFKVMMLRSRNFMVLARQDPDIAEDKRITLSAFEAHFTTNSVHKAKQHKPENSGRFRITRIPPEVAGWPFDGGSKDIAEELGRFGSDYMLACTSTT